MPWQYVQQCNDSLPAVHTTLYCKRALIAPMRTAGTKVWCFISWTPALPIPDAPAAASLPSFHHHLPHPPQGAACCFPQRPVLQGRGGWGGHQPLRLHHHHTGHCGACQRAPAGVRGWVSGLPAALAAVAWGKGVGKGKKQDNQGEGVAVSALQCSQFLQQTRCHLHPH
jgi:hypothetical protein